MKNVSILLNLPSLLILALSGCAPANLRETHAPTTPIPQVDLSVSTATAVDRLLSSMSPPLAPDTTVLVTSFVDLNGLSASSTSGVSSPNKLRLI